MKFIVAIRSLATCRRPICLDFGIFYGLEASVDRQHQAQNDNEDHCQLHAFIAGRVSEGMAPATGLREDRESSSEGRQVTGQALRMGQIGQRTHLQSVGSPSMIFVQIEAARGVQA